MDLMMFAILVFGIVLLPGMDMSMIASYSLARGRWAGAVALLGVIAGGMIHVLVAALGIASVLRQMPQAQNALLLCSAVYLIWIGIGIWRASVQVQFNTANDFQSRHFARKIFANAMLTNLLNPKAYLFMLAVFPQFVDFNQRVWPQALRMGVIIAAIQLLVYGAVVLIADRLRTWSTGDPRWQQRLARLVSLLLGLTAVMTLRGGWR
jgi:threonine/homoserine/homoserine lactone efflux protein